MNELGGAADNVKLDWHRELLKFHEEGQSDWVHYTDEHMACIKNTVKVVNGTSQNSKAGREFLKRNDVK